MIHNAKNAVFIVILLLVSSQILKGQGGMNPDSLVWPGDANNSGLVNHVDLLYLGAAFGIEGGSRNVQTLQWGGEEVPQNWGAGFGNGISYAFADCNGDGVVDEADVQAIEVNYGLEHDSIFMDSFAMNPIAQDLDMSLQGSGNIIGNPGAVYTIPLVLGSQNQPIQDFYGIAFTVEIDPEYVDMNQLSFVIEQSSWVDPNNEGLLQIKRKDFNQNTYEVAFTRKTMTNVSGDGIVGLFSIIIEGDVPDYADDTEILTIRDVHIIDKDLNQNYMIGDTPLLMDFTNSTKNLPSDSFRIYPNPVGNGICHIEGLDNYPSAELRLYDVVGREIRIERIENGIAVGKFPTGVYFLNINTPQGQLTEKLFIQN